MKPHRVKGWLAAAITALALLMLPVSPATVETYFSRGVYPQFQPWVTRLSNLAPFAVLDVLIIGVIALGVLRAVALARLARQGLAAAIWEAARRVVRFAGLGGTIFFLMWGLNYRRVPLESEQPHQVRPSVDDLRAAIAEANDMAAPIRPLEGDDALGFDAIMRRLPAPMNDALATLGRPPLGTAGRVKHSVILTPFFTRAGVDGMINPFGLETIVHPELLPFERPFAVGHEWAHLAGMADEAEASAVGWLACMSGPPEFAYSAGVYLIVEAGGALPAGAWRDVSARLDPGIRADLVALVQRQARQQPAVQRTAFRVYDSYLRANRVDDGVASYSRALSLILSPPLREALSRFRARSKTIEPEAPASPRGDAPSIGRGQRSP